jgi:hypothetical protein
MFYLYLIGAFLSCYISWKVFGERFKTRYGSYDLWIERYEFWYIFFITIAYPIIIPLLLLWKGLDYILIKYNLIYEIKRILKIDE